MLRGTLLLVVVGTIRVLAGGATPEVLVSAGDDDLTELLAESTKAATEKEERGRSLGQSEKLDPNRASDLQLDRLPGVGPSVARAIVDHREREGAFAEAKDLLAVRGLGQASLNRIVPHLDFSAPPPRALARIGRPGGQAVSKVALNSASLAELRAIPGIGPVIAGRILELRDSRGRFRALDDLLDVSGIGPKTLDRLRDRLKLDGIVP